MIVHPTSKNKLHHVTLTIGRLVYEFRNIKREHAKELFTVLSAAMNLEFDERGVLELQVDDE